MLPARLTSALFLVLTTTPARGAGLDLEFPAGVKPLVQLFIGFFLVAVLCALLWDLLFGRRPRP